ncbi:MAG: translocation/assembly module TamB, partial [Bacteroidaceae bacterium]|nr:translocation/assembly module TamB [Bacteroidaceae bacterium]
MRLSRRFKYFFRIFIWGFLAIHIGILVFLNLPFVQEKLSSILSKELSKLLQTEVTVGHVDVGLLNRIIVEDILLEDRQGEEMLKVARLSARYEILPLLNGRFSINSVQLFGFAFHLNRENPEAVPNYQFVLDALAPKDTLKKETNLDLRINSLLVRRGKIKYDVLSEPETPGRFNASHIDVENFAATISLKALKKDSLNAAIKRLSFTEQSGFALKKFRFKVEANNKSLKINDFLFEFPSSSLSIDSMVVRYDSLKSI